MVAPCDEVLILGDFNLTSIIWTPIHSSFFRLDLESFMFHAGAVKLLDNSSIATLSQINDEVNENNRSLDLCFVSGHTTAPSICLVPAPLVKDVAHHRPLVIAVEDNVMRDFFNPPAVVSYDFHKADHRSITEVLSNMDWEHILDPVNINSAAETFSHIMVYIIDRHVPKKSVRSDSRIPWMTNALRSLKRCKKAALRSYTKHRTLPLKFHYVRLNNEYKRISRYHFLRYQRGIQRRLRSHPKSFWSYVNEQRKETGFPSSMVFNSESASTQQDICNLFSSKFPSVFDDEQLPVDVVTTAASNDPLANQSLGDIEVNVEVISRAISKLKTLSKHGPDGVPSMILKKNITCLLEPLLQYLYQYQQYLCADQHGFTAGRSTSTNLLCLTSYVTDRMIAGLQTDVIYTELSVAFDKLNHKIAIAKLDRLEVGGNLLDWFRSYLTGRQLVVA
ncbi:uncharacterized protein LOC134207392 [Armigeres subalbatus]|uniref:uncharacterized protein LOC134207392 n=1 Tax=Armigeres subalbatus TaxID=124917 RepID=UPI002ED48248